MNNDVLVVYTTAYDSTDVNSQVVSPQYPGRQAYVYETCSDGKMVWFLATSNGENWVREVEG